MADAQVTMPVNVSPPPAVSGGMTVMGTTVAGLGTAGGAEVLAWVFQCISERRVVPPPQDVILVMSAASAPFVHAIGRRLMRRIEPADVTVATLTTPAAPQEDNHA